MGTSAKSGHGRMLAGDVAKTLGIGVQTLHYYEREGLIPPPDRTDSGYRLYTAELVDRVRFIRKAQALGLPLDEVKDILRLTIEGASPCGRVQAALAEKLREVTERLRELESFRDDLAALVDRAPALSDSSSSRHVCAIVEEAVPLRRAHATDKPLKTRRPRTA
jgi:MerR family transcriptional regulator, Zn(II)-responsive regulator of zntA